MKILKEKNEEIVDKHPISLDEIPLPEFNEKYSKKYDELYKHGTERDTQILVSEESDLFDKLCEKDKEFKNFANAFIKFRNDASDRGAASIILTLKDEYGYEPKLNESDDSEEQFNTQEAKELARYIKNTEYVYNRLLKPNYNNLIKKAKKGDYVSEKAIDAMYNVATEAAKLYCKEHCSATAKWFNIFSTSDRRATAKLLLKAFESDEIEPILNGEEVGEELHEDIEQETIPYRGFDIRPMVIKSIQVGDKEFDGFTFYVIVREEDEAVFSDDLIDYLSGEDNHKVRSADDAKKLIDKYIELSNNVDKDKITEEAEKSEEQFKLRFYKIGGNDEGNLDHEEFFETEDAMRNRYNTEFKRELFALNPTMWKKNNDEWERIIIKEQIEEPTMINLFNDCKYEVIDADFTKNDDKEIIVVLNHRCPDDIETGANELIRCLEKNGTRVIDWNTNGDNVFTFKVDEPEEALKESAEKKYEIRWIDAYARSNGDPRELYLHNDEIKANTFEEALRKLADNVALGGVGTNNAVILNAHNVTDGISYMATGKLSHIITELDLNPTLYDESLNEADEGNQKEKEVEEEPKDYSEKTVQGYEVKEIYTAPSKRKYAIIFRPTRKDYAVAAGYRTETGVWDQGYYDMTSMEDAKDTLKWAVERAGDEYTDI